MASLFNIMKITIDAKKLRARVLVNPGMPVMTSEDIEATARVYYLAPAIAKHVCLGDAGREFQDCMGDTARAPARAPYGRDSERDWPCGRYLVRPHARRGG